MDTNTLVGLVIGLLGLLGGAELLVRGASRLALAAGISPLVVGLTVVAYGTSAPELAVSVQSAAAGQANIALGNVVGSNIFNVLFILGLSALITPLVVSVQLVRFDVPLMIGVALLLLLLGFDGTLGRLDGALLAGGALLYTVWSIVQSRRETRQAQEALAGASKPSSESSPSSGWLGSVALLLVGLTLLVVGANLLVNGAVAIAHAFGISELVIGLTIVAVGTSLPEVATSLMASIKGERDIAVGNVVGSNIFNILAVLGLSSLVAPQGISVSSVALQFDIPVMIAVSVACLPIFFTGYCIARWEGALFFAYYLAYTAYLVLHASNAAALPQFRTVMLFVVPLTAITLVVLALRARTSSSSTTSHT